MAFIHPRHSIEPHVFLGKTFIDPNLKPEPPFDFGSLFENGEQGFFIDPSNLDTLYEDALMQQKVTANQQTVSITLDSIKKNVISDNVWDWSKASASGESVVDKDNQTASIISTDGAASQISCGVGVVGALYEVSLEVESITGRITFDFLNAPTISTVGRHTFKAITVSAALTIKRSGVVNAVIKNIVIRRIGELNAYQGSSSAKPRYQDKYLEFDGVDDFLMLPVFQLPQPFTVIMAVETVKLSGTQALFSSGQSGYLLMSTSGLNLGTQQNTGNPVIYQPKNLIDVLTHRAENGLVKFKTNIGESSSSELVANNPYSAATQKYIGNFNNTSFSTAAGIRLYAMLVINRALTDEEETAVRKEFNKRMGIV